LQVVGQTHLEEPAGPVASASAPATNGATAASRAVGNVQPGDSLGSIAQLFYNDASRWRAIYAANRGVIGANPNRIQPGQTLNIP
jgi:nucleoid-associated protein YgaU